MAVEANLGKVRLTEEEMRALVERHTGGVRLGVDEEGNYGYYKYDEEAGADTLVPFKSGGVRSIKLKQSGNGKYINGGSSIPNILYLQNPDGIRKITANGKITAYNTSSTGTQSYGLSLTLNGRRRDTGTALSLTVASVKTTAGSSAQVQQTVENKEIDISQFDLSNPIYFSFYINAKYSGGSIDMEYEIAY